MVTRSACPVAPIGVEAVRFAEVAVVTLIIALEPGESGVAFVQGGGEEQDAVLVNQGGALVEKALDLVLRRRRRSTRPTESPVVDRPDSRFGLTSRVWRC